MIFSPSLEILYRDRDMPFADKMKRAHALGFSAFEFWSWWDKDVEEISRESRELGIRAASCCVKGAPLVDPSQRGAFLEGLKVSLEAAERLDCPYLIVLTGNELENVSREAQLQSVAEGLRESVPLLERTSVTLVLEPLNTLVDHRGYFLSTTEEAVRIIDAVASERVKLLFDVYHQQITEGNLIPNLTRFMDRIGYIHIADHPGRHEPGTGEIHYGNVLSAIAKAGYAGYVGLEFSPTGEPDEVLSRFMEQYKELRL
ncbi:hydroxypyruvate isomerase family protein [Paenibacillus alkalitolerans]|uniref:hydroxypyruvate isomerase family protein n=1 Tax=Paenibacillus alkalitolerans TaxID=2799335 RepID=UPI0018F4E004|nr:TIM barrel protein [Paenibacillus alkalitolerans]